MHFVVKQNDHPFAEFRCARGPVYIGRHVNSQIFLNDRSVSRHHAVVFGTADGKWIVEDLDSANKTYLNNQMVRKAEIKTGDILRVSGFTIKVNLEEDTYAGQTVDLEEMLTTPSHEAQIIVRKPDSEHARDIRLPARRAKNFMLATEAICKANGLDEVLQVVLRIVAKQFSTYRTWCTLRDEPAGPMACQAGRRQDGQTVLLSEIELGEKINETVEEKQFLLFPWVPVGLGKEKIRSAIIAPVMTPAGCYGVLYLDNTMEHEQYSLADLDYLMLLSVHTAAIVENF